MRSIRVRALLAVVSVLPMMFGAGGGYAAASPFSVPGVIDAVVPPPAGDIRHLIMPSPSGDSFFDTTPNNIGALTNGQLIRTRKVIAHTNVQFGPNVRHVLQLKFRTNDSHGKPTFGTATAIIPKGQLAQRGILVNNVPINSLGRQCTPGYKIAHGEIETGQYTPPITVMGNTANYVVLIPDHEGPTMAYGEPIMGGHVVLDAVKALRNAYPALAESRFAMRGYSGGSIVTYGATTLMSEYAPSLVPQYAGASLGGTPIDQRLLTQSMPGVLNWAKGLFWAGTAGIARQNLDLLQYANNATRWVMTSPLKDMCSSALTPLGVLPIPPEWVVNVQHPFSMPAAQALYGRLNLNHRPSAGPLYVYNGEQEFWIQAQAARNFVRDQRALGVSVTYVPVAGEHITGELLGFGPATAWLERQLAAP